MSPRFTLRINQAAAEALTLLPGLDTDQFQRLLEALQTTNPRVRGWDYAADVAGKVSDIGDEARAIVYGLVILSAARVARNLTPEKFVPYVLAAIDEDEELSDFFDEDDEETLRERLSSALSLEDNLGITAKALDVMSQDEHLFCSTSTRVVTDWRPVFPPQLGHRPLPGAIIHTLKIAYHEGEDLNEFHVALTETEIGDLQAVLNRALDKAADLKDAMRGTNTINLEG